MGILKNQFPYTNFHELNLDWLLQKVQELEAQVESVETVQKVNDALVITVKDGVTSTTSKDVFDAYVAGKLIYMVADGKLITDLDITSLSNFLSFSFKTPLRISEYTNTSATLSYKTYNFQFPIGGSDSSLTIGSFDTSVTLAKEV